MDKEDIKKLAIEQLSKETTVAKYFVTIDLQDEFVDRCILIAQQRELLIAYEKKRSETILMADTDEEIVDEIMEAINCG